MASEIDIVKLDQFPQCVYVSYLICHFVGECVGERSGEGFHDQNRRFGTRN